MAVTLETGRAVPIPANTVRLLVGFQWQSESKTQRADLDTACMIFDDIGQMVEVVSFREIHSPDYSIDHRDPAPDEARRFRELFHVDFQKMIQGYHQIVFLVHSFTGLDFHDVPAVTCRVRDADRGQELVSWEAATAGRHCVQIMGKLYREGQSWALKRLDERATCRAYRELERLYPALLA